MVAPGGCDPLNQRAGSWSRKGVAPLAEDGATCQDTLVRPVWTAWVRPANGSTSTSDKRDEETDATYAIFYRMADKTRSKNQILRQSSLATEDATATSVKTAKPEAKTAMDQSSPPLPTETPIWGHPTLSVEHPWTGVRSGKPGPGKSPPGSPNEPSNEVRHLKYLAATTNNTVQKPPDNGNP